MPKAEGVIEEETSVKISSLEAAGSNDGNLNAITSNATTNVKITESAVNDKDPHDLKNFDPLQVRLC
jgi:hypothetical protein